jgi:hypothetical protein
MTAITTPIPEPIAPAPAPQVEPETGWSISPLVAAGVVVILAISAAGAWRSLRSPTAEVAPAADLASTLDWMFDATLTHRASTADGIAVGAPFQEIRMSDVDVLDPTTGPIVVTAVGVRPDGGSTELTYRIDVRRRGDGWTISAVPITQNPVAATADGAPAGSPATASVPDRSVSRGGN